MDRRTFITSSLGTWASFGAISCNRDDDRPMLKVFTWADYLDPAVASEFEQTHRCRLIIDTFDSNESMFAKLSAGGNGYDVLVPTSYMVKLLRRREMLLPLDHSLLPALAHVDADYLKQALDPGMDFSVPYMMAPTCIAWLSDKVKDPLPSYRMFSRTDLGRRMTLLDDMREVLGAALRLLGYRLNSTDPGELAQARDLVRSWKPNLAKFDNEQYKAGIASGEFHVVQGYAGDLLQVAEDQENLVIAIPQEGGAFSCDDLCISKNSSQAGLAHRFIDFLTQPEIAARNMRFIQYRAPNATAYRLLPEDFRGNAALFPAADVFARLEPIDDLGNALPLWTAMWDEVKAS